MAKKLVAISMDRDLGHLKRVQREYQQKETGKWYKKWVHVKEEEFQSTPRRRHVREPDGQRKPAQQDPNAQKNRQAQQVVQKPGQPAQQEPNRASRPPQTPQNQPNAQPKAQQPRPAAARPEKPFKPARRQRGGGKYHYAEIRHNILRDKDFAMEEMFLMQEYQTPKEKELYKHTRYKNVVGFNQPDSRVFTKFMDAIKGAGGLRKLQEKLGDNFGVLEREIQMRMAKYSKQLADIHNDNNMYRNFKTIKDMFKEAKGLNDSEVANFTGGLQSRNFKDMGKDFVGTGMKQFSAPKEQKRGPKQKADAVVKRFENGKYAAEVYHMMNDVGMNGNSLIKDRYNRYREAWQTFNLGHIDRIMEQGFANLVMKEKTKLKDAMKKMAPYVADIFNAYKDLGIGLPTAKALRGKGLKSIKDDYMNDMMKVRDERLKKQQGEPAKEKRLSENIRELQGDPAYQRLKEEFDKRQQEEEAKKKAPPIEKVKPQPKAGDNLRGTAKMFRDNEAKFEQNIPTKLDQNNMPVADNKGINGTYQITMEDGGHGFYKPGIEERIGARTYVPGDYYVREVMAYETAKVFHLDDMVSPTKFMSPEVTKGGRVRPADEGRGSVQQAAQEFGKMMGLSKIKSANAYGKTTIFSSTDNAQDMMVMDFIIANTDRHSGNFFAGKTADGKHHVLPIDHGLGFTTKTNVDSDQWNTVGTQRSALQSKVGNKAIRKDFQDAIANFDGNAYKELASKTGLDKKSANAVVERVGQLQEYIKNNNNQGFTMHDLREVLREYHNYDL